MKFIEVVSIPVSNQEVAKEFYLKIGFQVIVEAPMGDGNTWVQLGIPGQTTSISLVTWFTKGPAGTLQGMVLKTDDIQADVAELKAKGIDVQPIDDTPWGKFASFYDPDGNGLILREGE
jgi:catechol 2,3-dioxygenase-like lactoylglutathione lyase family enzyme